MSSAFKSSVPYPREVWRAATEGKRLTITVQPPSGDTVEFTGDITNRRKVGSKSDTYVTVVMVPENELAPVEIEAGKERGEWGPFRAFNWTQRPYAKGPEDYYFQFVGKVQALDITGVRWDSDGGEVANEGVA